MLQLRVGSKEFLLTPDKLSTIMTTLKGCDVIDEHHVGTNKGTQGYGNSYVPVVYTPSLKTALTCLPVDEDLVETIKLTMKLNDVKI